MRIGKTKDLKMTGITTQPAENADADSKRSRFLICSEFACISTKYDTNANRVVTNANLQKRKELFRPGSARSLNGFEGRSAGRALSTIDMSSPIHRALMALIGLLVCLCPACSEGGVARVQSSSSQEHSTEEKTVERTPGENCEFAGIEFVWIPRGRFIQGGEHSNGALPVREVEITRGFWLGRSEVTQRQWEKVMGANPSRFKGPELPVESISWKEAMKFTQRLSSKESIPFRLPTEAEWEYACNITSDCALTDASRTSLEEIAWFRQNSEDITHAVGDKRCGSWGLFDMLGNVAEWCQDTYMGYGHEKGDRIVVDPVCLPKRMSSWDSKIARGGSYASLQFECTCTYRDYYPPHMSLPTVGFRLVCDEE